MPLSSPTHPDTLVSVSPQEAGLDPEGLRHVEQVMRDGLGTVYPAATLLVAQDGRVVLHSAYGCLDPETGQRPTQPDSLFDLASVSKLFTATAFMTLVEAGRVMVDTPVADVLRFLGCGTGAGLTSGDRRLTGAGRRTRRGALAAAPGWLHDVGPRLCRSIGLVFRGRQGPWWV